MERRAASLAVLWMQFWVQEECIPPTISRAVRAAEIEADVRAVGTPIDQELLAEVQAVFEPVRNFTRPSRNRGERP